MVLQAYLTVVQGACVAEMPLPHVAKESCFMPKGTIAVPIWVPTSTPSLELA